MKILCNFLYADDFEVLDSLFHKYSLSKYFGSMFHILRFQGYHINPFSFLGSICYIKEIKIICHFFKIYTLHAINTLHNVISLDNPRNEIEIFNLEKCINKENDYIKDDTYICNQNDKK